MRRLTVALIVLVLSVPFGSGPASASGSDVAVRALGTAFSPSLVTVTLLDTVVWTNAETGGVRHTVTATSGAWTLNQDLGPGESVRFSFPTTGTYGYRCLRHAGMTGQVVVDKGQDPDIVARLDAPTADGAGSIPVTGLVSFRGALVSSEPVTDVRFRSADHNPTVKTVPLDATGDTTATRFDTITWTATGEKHQVRALSGPAGVDWSLNVEVPAGGSFSHRFPAEGTYTYRCDLHPASAARAVVVSTTFTEWTSATFGDGAWRLDVDFNGLAQGAQKYYEVRAETARAYQRTPTSFVVRAAHEPFDIALLRADTGVVAEGDTLSGNVPLLFEVGHALWEPGRVEVRLWNTKSASGNAFHTGTAAAPELQTLSTVGSPATLVRQGGNTYKIVAGQTTRYYPSGNWATATIPDGEYDVVIKAVVPDGVTTTMTREAAFRVVLDNYLDVLGPAGQKDRIDLGTVGGIVTLSGSVEAPPEGVAAPTAVQWAVVPCTSTWAAPTSWNGGSYSVASRAWSLQYDTAAISAGESCVDVRVTPGDGTAYARLRHSMAVVNTPTVGFDTHAQGANVAGVVTLGGPVTTTGHAIDKVEVKVDAGSFVPVTVSAGRWSYTLDTGSLSNADHTVQVRATTVATHSSSLTRTLRVGNAPTVGFSTPAADGATLSGTASFAGPVTTPGFPIQKVEVRVDSGTPVEVPVAAGAWSFALDTTTMSNGPHSVTAVATTTRTHTASATRTFTVANAPTKDLRPTLDAPANPAAPFVTAVTITGRLFNDGNEKIPQADLNLKLEYSDSGRWYTVTPTVSYGTSTGLDGFASTTFTLTWSRPATEVYVGTFPIRVSADALAKVAETDETDNVATGAAHWVSARAPTRVAPDRATEAAAALQGCATNATAVTANKDAQPVCQQLYAARNATGAATARAQAAATALQGCATNATAATSNKDAQPVCQQLSSARNGTGSATARAERAATALQGCATNSTAVTANKDAQPACQQLYALRNATGAAAARAQAASAAAQGCVVSGTPTNDSDVKPVCDQVFAAKATANATQTTAQAIRACAEGPGASAPEGDVVAGAVCDGLADADGAATRADAAATALATCVPAGAPSGNADAKAVCDAGVAARAAAAGVGATVEAVDACRQDPGTAAPEGDVVADAACDAFVTTEGPVTTVTDRVETTEAWATGVAVALATCVQAGASSDDPDAKPVCDALVTARGHAGGASLLVDALAACAKDPSSAGGSSHPQAAPVCRAIGTVWGLRPASAPAAAPLRGILP